MDISLRHYSTIGFFLLYFRQMRSSVSNNSSVCVSPTEDLSMTLTTCADGVEPAENNRVSAATAKAIEARTITTYHLICYAYQICCGMQYLVSKKVSVLIVTVALNAFMIIKN